MISAPVRVPSRVSTCRVVQGCASTRICALAMQFLPPMIRSWQSSSYGATRARRPLPVASSALDEFVIEGVATTIPFHRRVLDNATFNSCMCTRFHRNRNEWGQL